MGFLGTVGFLVWAFYCQPCLHPNRGFQIQQNISEILVTNFWVKILKWFVIYFFPSSLLFDLREGEYVSRDRIITAPPPSRERKKFRSGVTIPEPQQCNLQNLTANGEQAPKQEKAKAIKY